MRYNIRDVASEAGVSVATVSRVINKGRYVAPETRQRVLIVAQRLNFLQNVHARRLARGRSDLFGLIISEIANPFFPEIIKGFEGAAIEGGFDVLLYNTEYGPERIEASVRMMISNQVRGVAVMTSVLDRKLAEDMAAIKIPVVLLDQTPPGRLISTIQIDYEQGVSKAIAYLRDLGHKLFAFVAGPPGIQAAVRFREAFNKVMESHGLRDSEIVQGDHKVGGGITAAKALVNRSPMPTAILCGNDLTALGVVTGMEEAGLRVPEDVSVVGFDDIFFAKLFRPPLSTIRVEREGLGRLAFDTLLRALRDKRKQGVQQVCETQLVVRRSTAPRPGSGAEFSPCLLEAKKG